jgi:hypothetical protein
MQAQEIIEAKSQELLEKALILDKDKIELLNSFEKQVNEFIQANKDKANSEEEIKDKLYEDVKAIWNSYQDTLRDTLYNFNLTKHEFKLLKKIIFRELEYTEDNIFIALRVKNNFFDAVSEPNNSGLTTYNIKIDDIIFVHHLIKEYKVKGLTEDSYNFASLIEKIGEISKLFNMFNATSKELSTQVQNWTAGLTGPDLVESEDTVEVDTAEVDTAE